ncbi:rubredoxin [Streptomyces sp. NPDC012746]|uniref:rubredoxin n=1 Tax=Streptomyces sp. NPDC012746 TaxID=3364845 RepID=UPI0036810F27
MRLHRRIHIRHPPAPLTGRRSQAPQTVGPCSRAPSPEARLTSDRCAICRQLYDPVVGDPDTGIPAGMPFEELLPRLRGASKADFEPAEG